MKRQDLLLASLFACSSMKFNAISFCIRKLQSTNTECSNEAKRFCPRFDALVGQYHVTAWQQTALHLCLILRFSALEWLANFLAPARGFSSFSPVFAGVAPLGPWAKEPCLWRRPWKHVCSPCSCCRGMRRRVSRWEEASVSRCITGSSALEEAAEEVLQVRRWAATCCMIWRGSRGHRRERLQWRLS